MRVCSIYNYITIVLLALVLGVVGCGRARQSDDALGDSVSSATMDSSALDTTADHHRVTRIELDDDDPSSAIEAMMATGEWDKYEQGIIPAVAKKSLQYAENLLNNEYERFIVVDKSRMKVLLFDKYGRLERSYGMACGKNYGTKREKADSRTPEGYFSVQGIYDSTEWLYTDDNGKTSDKKGQFGPRFIRIRIPGTSQIGIHGTCAPWSIGARASHGCIRLKNENILELVEMVEPGMPVIIVPGSRDIASNAEIGKHIPWIPTGGSVEEPGLTTKKKEKKDSTTTEKNEKVVEVEIEHPHVEQDTLHRVVE